MGGHIDHSSEDVRGEPAHDEFSTLAPVENGVARVDRY